MVYGIVIATKTDGAKVAIGDPMALSKAKVLLQKVTGADLKTVELFELRKARKRRKLNRARKTKSTEDQDDETADPSMAEIAKSLFEKPNLISEAGYGSDGIPNVKALNKAFDVKLNAEERDVIWEKVKELKTN